MNVIISKNNSKTKVSEIIQARYLILQLAIRDFTVRYKQTSLGWLWAIINPLTSFMLYAYVFGLLVRVPTPEYNAPYSAVLIVGILFWNFFSSSLNLVSDSLINNVGLINKVFFPRISFGIASVFVSFLDFIIALVFFIPVLIYLKVDFNLGRMLVFVPLCAFITLMLAWGIGSWMAILKVKFKDFRHIVPLLLQVIFYASPIVYTSSLIPKEYQSIYNINPFAHVLELARYAILNSSNEPAYTPALLGAVLIAILGGSYFIFNERKVVDLE
ncbi:ABC transporter permease [Pantoea septica]|uniref:ABC transporter permease n=1 Tax=Pantoea septica TaxID=472695 RepID=UPI0028A213EF|nr:ABC transporter permease [Pantoea septica]